MPGCLTGDGAPIRCGHSFEAVRPAGSQTRLQWWVRLGRGLSTIVVGLLHNAHAPLRRGWPATPQMPQGLRVSPNEPGSAEQD